MTEAATLKITRQDGMADFEQHLRLPDLGGRALTLPKNIRGGGSLGRSVGLTQLVVTWAQRSDSPEVKMYIQAEDDLPSFVERLYGFAATYFADSVTIQGNDTDIRMNLMRSCRPRIVAMSKGTLGDTAKGRKVEFILAHHAKNQFHSALYKRAPTRSDLLDRQRHGELIADPIKMAHLLQMCAAQYRTTNSKAKRRLIRLLDSHGNPLGQLLHESFRNTAEHAYLEVDGQIPPRGMRSITIATQQINREDLLPSTVLSSEHPGAAGYFRKLRSLYQPPGHPYRGRKHIDVFEISVLDSGPGFAHTISSGHVGAEIHGDDQKLVAQCFRKHRSAKPGPASGLGLNRMLEHVHALDGFMRVRTSTTEAFFAAAPDYSPAMNPEDFVRGGLAAVKGTSITFGIPIVY